MSFEPDEPRGVQKPRIQHLPPAVKSAGPYATELAAAAGLHLDPWQRLVLDGGLGERADKRWAAFEVSLIVARQNGKGAILEALELAALFLFEERLVLHSAHEFKTAREAFLRTRGLIDGCDDLRKRVYRVYAAHGEEGIELLDGARLRFIARSKGSGRGFSPDRVILDEAHNLSLESMAALMPSLSARKNPQIWYTSSPGDYLVAPCEQLARIRRRAVRGGDPSLAFFEWSAPYDENGQLLVERDDPRVWAQANPALGIRITHEQTANELRSIPTKFDIERLGVGRWPFEDDGERVIPAEIWEASLDPDSDVLDPVAFSIDMTPERSHVAVAVAGRRTDNRQHVEVVEHRGGTRWVKDEVVRLQATHNSLGFWIDRRSPAGSLMAELQEAGVEVREMSTTDVVKACGNLYDAALEDRLVHIGQPTLDAALAAARKRRLGDAWAWDRTRSNADICPLVAVTNALHGYQTSVGADYDVLASVY
jgi:phage terminase large subunit-like protein